MADKLSCPQVVFQTCMNFSILLNTKEDILRNADHFAMVLYSTVVN